MKHAIILKLVFLLCLCLEPAASAPLSKERTGFLTKSDITQVQAGEVVSKAVSLPEREGLTFEVIGEMLCTAEELLDVLMDYEKYPEFMSTVKDVAFVEQQADTSILNFYLSLPMGMTKKYRIKIGLTQPGPHSWLLEWEMIDWPGIDPDDTIRDTEGYWLIKELSMEKHLVIYRVYSDPGRIPYGLKWLVSPISQKSVTQTFLDARNRIEKTRRPQAP